MYIRQKNPCENSENLCLSTADVGPEFVFCGSSKGSGDQLHLAVQKSQMFLIFAIQTPVEECYCLSVCLSLNMEAFRGALIAKRPRIYM